MTIRVSRRDALRVAGLGALALAHPPFLTACSGSSQPRATGLRALDGGLSPLIYDPNVSWWMQHNYGPVTDEIEQTELEVEGAIPTELEGLYVRNGSNPKHGDPGHWFIGDGMVHGVRLSGGKALWYRNRYLETPLLDKLPADGGSTAPPDGANTDANVSVISHAGRLLALGEVGFPYQVSTTDLSTVGPYDFAGKLATWFTAHPKIDPVTGEMLAFGYGIQPFVTYHRIDAAGALTKSVQVDLQSPVMMHDFQVTATRVLFMDLPIILDLDMAISGVPFPFRWKPDNGARLWVMPRDGDASNLKKVEIDPCFMFHTLNAYDADDGSLVLEASRYEQLWVEGNTKFDASPTLHRYTIDRAVTTAKLDTIDDRLVEFPQLDRRVWGRKNRYGYGLWLGDSNGEGHPNGVRGIIKFDRSNDTSTVHAIDPALQPDEAFFVPASKDAGEDDGWLLTYVYDRRTDTSSLYILDASRMDAPPVAKIKLKVRVPFGFHGVWVPGDS